MSNDTTVSVSAFGGALAVISTFVAGQFGLDIPGEVGAAIGLVFTAVLGSVLPR